MACEHPRRTRLLLTKHNITLENKTFIQLADGREAKPTDRILTILETGNDVALVSDAGTPLISDPGFPLIQATHTRQYSVVPIPGASAVTTLASVCPIPLNSFRFIGFLDANRKHFKMKISELVNSSDPTIFYASPKDITKILRAIEEEGSRQRTIFLGREITKMFESFAVGTVEELLLRFDQDLEQKGEFTMVVEGAPDSPANIQLHTLLDELMKTNLRDTDIARIIGRISPLTRKVIYERIRTLKLKKSDKD